MNLVGIPESVERLLADLRSAVADLPREARPALCGALAALQAETLLVPAQAPPKAEEKVLSPAEAASRIGRSRDWIYRNRHALPTTRLPSGRWGVRETALSRWLENRSR